MFKKIVLTWMLIGSAFFFALDSYAQEVLRPLNYNPVIKEFLKTQAINPVANMRSRSMDTISLPFIDDFSGSGIYPVDSLWSDSDVFINKTFGDHPITVGVATFDGIDKYGNPYDSSSTSADTADFLTSNPIHLNFPGSTDVWLSFYYQPEGLGEAPHAEDSLTLQFQNNLGEWNTVWDAAGRTDTAFHRVNINITDSSFLYNGFRFRFMNYAFGNSNREHWNVDYVWLDNGRFDNDTIPDVAFVNPQKSLLTEFQAMPWAHYLASSSISLVSSMTDVIHNINYGTTSVGYNANILDSAGNILFNLAQTVNSVSGDELSLTSPLGSFTFQPNTSDHADFYIRNYFGQTGSFNYSNDTIMYHQEFSNYYAYDDGTAEWDYGINEANAKIAYRFDVKMSDTLQGVQIYFNPNGYAVHNQLFQLCVWSNINVSTNSETVIYKKIDLHPANIDSINGFATYLLDSGIYIPAGPVYIGWIQNSNVFLGIGVDRNNNASNNMFAFYSSIWHPSQISGAWMMRPLFGKEITIGINEPLRSISSFNVYPNPASTAFTIKITDSKENFGYQLFNNLGEKILSGTVNLRPVDVSMLANGFYFVRITDQKTGAVATRKLIIQHN
jgi:hypothetical protein